MTHARTHTHTHMHTLLHTHLYTHSQGKTSGNAIAQGNSCMHTSDTATHTHTHTHTHTGQQLEAPPTVLNLDLPHALLYVDILKSLGRIAQRGTGGRTGGGGGGDGGADADRSLLLV